ncbi:hypothetical protein OG292_19675 [Streptomyces sp. NBC_01511]|uniref:hypothetical protein n=1 Tax=Streptomyces sp. NBC_01511 TaxID=2903889 RepID=UPI00386D5BB2
MPSRTFTLDQLAALGVPPDSPDDIQHDPALIADEHVTTLKYSQQRRVVFRADDGKNYAVKYEAPINMGDFEVSGDGPPDHGWYGNEVEAIEVAEHQVTVTQWLPVESTATTDPR